MARAAELKEVMEKGKGPRMRACQGTLDRGPYTWKRRCSIPLSLAVLPISHGLYVASAPSTHKRREDSARLVSYLYLCFAVLRYRLVKTDTDVIALCLRTSVCLPT